MLTPINYKPNPSQLGRFLLSLVLATMLWGWVTQLQDPFKNEQIPNLTIQATDISDDLQIITTLPKATVTLSGSESDLARVSVSEVLVTLDTSSIDGPGLYRVPVRVADVEGTSKRKVEPSEVQIQVEQRETMVFPLTLTTAPVATDDPRRIGQVTPSVSQVTATGPSSAIGRIDKIVLPIALAQQTSTFTGEFSPVAVDADGQTISEVMLLPGTVSAEVEIQTRGKSVSVIPRIIGVPSEGFTVQQRAALPETILVDGPAEQLDKLLFVNTEPVDITGATASISRRVAIADLPAGMTIVDPAGGTVEVRVAIEDIAGQATEFSSLMIETVGVGEGLTAEIAPVTADVSVLAPRSLLETMTSDDIKVRVDVTGLGPGTYTLTPDVTVPQRVTWLGNDPSEVTVVITESTSSPESTPAASPGSTVPASDSPVATTPEP